MSSHDHSTHHDTGVDHEPHSDAEAKSFVREHHDYDCSCGHSHDGHEHAAGCACQQILNSAPLTADEQAAIAEDPSTGSLARALKGGFAFLKIAMLLLLLFFTFDRFRSVREGEIMVVKRFGAFITDDSGEIKIYEPGRIYFLLPAPIDEPVVLRVAEAKEIDLGAAFYPRVDDNSSTATLPVLDALDPVADGYNLSGDLNILHTRWKVKYRIADYRAYLMTAVNNDPAALLTAIVKNAIIRNFSGITVDDAYYGDHRVLFDKIEEATRDELAKMNIGIEIDGGVTNQTLLPPGSATAAFSQVTSSLSERQKLIDEARKNAAIILKEAETEAMQINHAALQYQATVVADSQANAVRIRELSARFPNDSAGLQLYLNQYRYDRLIEILATAKIYLLRGGANIFWTAPLPDYLDK